MSSLNFRRKDRKTQALINEALDMLDAFGIPMTATGRRRESMAMAFIAIAGATPATGWSDSRDFEQARSLKSRDIIDYRNRYLGESGSPGSYDDVRRLDLKPLITANIVVNSLPGSAHNAPNRGYALHPAFAQAVRAYGTPKWRRLYEKVMADYETLREQLTAERKTSRVPIILPSGIQLEFGPGPHNELQRQVVEQFLPRFGYGARVLYLGDAEDKGAYLDEPKLKELGFFELAHEELPDVVAFSSRREWMYVIEAVASSGPVDAYRHTALRKLLRGARGKGTIYVTAFLERGKVFRQYVPEISWETEVWIAAEPDHLIHFNGERFLGPYVT